MKAGISGSGLLGCKESEVGIGGEIEIKSREPRTEKVRLDMEVVMDIEMEIISSWNINVGVPLPYPCLRVSYSQLLINTALLRN